MHSKTKSETESKQYVTREICSEGAIGAGIMKMREALFLLLVICSAEEEVIAYNDSIRLKQTNGCLIFVSEDHTIAECKLF